MRLILGFFLFILFGCQSSTVITRNDKAEIEVSVLMLDQSLHSFTLTQGSTLADLLKLFECLDCDLSRLNPNQILYPNDHIVLTPKVSECISINSSSVDELDRLSGIGPALAQKIIDYRQSFGLFQRLEDLMNIKGIKEKLFEKVKDAICLCARPSILSLS